MKFTHDGNGRLFDGDRLVAEVKTYNLDWRDIAKILCTITEDGIWCPRCGDVFHDEDIVDNPDDYYCCDKCYTIQHTKCRGI